MDRAWRQWRTSVIGSPGAALEIDDEVKSILLELVSLVTEAEWRTKRSRYILQPAIAPNPLLAKVDYVTNHLDRATQRYASLHKIW